MKSMIKMTRKNLLGALVLVPLFGSLAGCTRSTREFGTTRQFQPVDMWNRTRLKPYEGVADSEISSARAMPVGAIARGQLRENEALYYGKENGKLVTTFPIPLTEATLKRGQERYTIYCAPCHGGLGDGKGVIITRGFSPPPDYYEDKRVLNAPIGHYYDVITNGYGAMYSYAARVPVNDRWAIAAYIRLLQRARAQGQNSGSVLPGGGVYERLAPVKAAGHEEGHEPAATSGHEAGATTEKSAPGSVPNSYVTGSGGDPEHKASGTGAGLSEPRN